MLLGMGKETGRGGPDFRSGNRLPTTEEGRMVCSRTAGIDAGTSGAGIGAGSVAEEVK